MKKICITAFMLIVFFAVASCTRTSATTFCERVIYAECVKYLGFGEGFYVELTVLLENNKKYNKLILYPETLKAETQTFSFFYGTLEGVFTKSLYGYQEASFPYAEEDVLFIAAGGKKTAVELTEVLPSMDIYSVTSAAAAHFAFEENGICPQDVEIRIKILYDLRFPHVYIYVGVASAQYLYSALLNPQSYEIVVSEILPAQLNS